MHYSEMFSDDRHVIFFGVLLQLTQQTHFITPDKRDSIPLLLTKLNSDYRFEYVPKTQQPVNAQYMYSLVSSVM